MAKLYPPHIEGKLPAFTGSTITVPLTMNKAVKVSDVNHMRLIIKSVQSGRQLTKEAVQGSLSKNEKTGKYSALFTLGNFQPTIGQYYKIQIAYEGNDGIGYYSSVGVAKYTTVPSLSIPGLENSIYGKYDYVGLYQQSGASQDGSERIYSYCFTLEDSDGKVVDTSGVLLHNSENDKVTNESTDSWGVRRNLEKNKPYYLTYSVTTMNGLECSSSRYLIMDQDSVDIEMPIQLIAELQPEDAYIDICLQPTVANTVIHGSFILSRSSSLDNFATWDEVYRFTYTNLQVVNRQKIALWKDFTVQQGIEYVYSLQAYNSYGLHSNRLMNVNNITEKIHSPIKVDFEDCFLYDGKRQLKIRFNPKVSSIKNTVLETKTDTLGSKYPFIFRNGNVNYKEFPVSGLISLVSDPNELFLKGIQHEIFTSNRNMTPAAATIPEQNHHLTGDNFRRERDFKIAAMDWLTDGNPKLFRSPAEGNFVVRLMNTSLTPNDTLGRMIHTFSSTAYEVSDTSFDSLKKFGIVNDTIGDTMVLKIGQIKISDFLGIRNAKERAKLYPNFSNNGNNIKTPSMTLVNITEATPGTLISFTFSNGQAATEIEIGGTGAYYVQVNEYPITNVTLLSGNWDDAKLTFGYYDDTPSDTFSQITNIISKDIIRQEIGTGFKINLVGEESHFTDIRKQVSEFHYIRVAKRPIEKLWKINGVYHRNKYGTDPMRMLHIDQSGSKIQPSDWNPVVIYQVMGENGITWLDGDYSRLMNEEPDFRFAMNPKSADDYIDFSGRKKDDDIVSKFGDISGRFDAYRNVGKVQELRVGSGLIVDLVYREQVREFAVEATDAVVADKKRMWEDQLTHTKEVIIPTETIVDPSKGFVVKQQEIDYNIQLTEEYYRKFVDALEKRVMEDNQ